MSWEKQPRKRRGQGESAANEQPPPLQLPKELKRRRRARAQQTNVQRHFHPSRWTEVEREGKEPHGMQHQVHPETPPPPSYPAPLNGEKKQRRKSREAELPKKFARGEKPHGAGGTEPEGRDFLRSLYDFFIAKSSHFARDQSIQKSQVMSLVQTLPLHLAQVGWGSLSNEDRNAPHFQPPIPGQIRNSLDIIKKIRIRKILK